MSTLVLPNNYVEVSDNEMMYLDGGGFSGSVFYKNVRGLTGYFRGAWGAVFSFLKSAKDTISYWAATTKLGGAVARLGAAVGGLVGAAIVALSAAAAIYWMGSKRRFY